MTKILVTMRSGQSREITASNGISVMENIRESGIDDLAALCGGTCSCATCHVYVEAAWSERLVPATEGESELLSGSSHRKDGSRLSCQIVFDETLDGLAVKIAPED